VEAKLSRLKEILQKNQLNSCIIVSSPYHMKRVQAVARKILQGYRICLVPIQKSIFFGNRSSVQVKHMRAILHEYLALLYYAYKEYI
jgi:uncharacterized SAM-binding protein YcdF (DUF218 family)